jgi:type II secretory pathway component GspD/PulD (secretin)
VVLGGLIKESSTNIETKVPVLGDIPFIGALFRKNTDTTERRNLLIFVTASVLNQEDSLVARLDEEQGI